MDSALTPVFVKEAIDNIEKNQFKFENMQWSGVKDGWDYCSECGFLQPLTDEEIEYYRKEGIPEEFLKRKNHKKFEGRTIPLEKAKAIHRFVEDWMKDLGEFN